MSAWSKTKEFLKPVFRSLVCLVLCAALILGCLPQKAEALAVETTVGLGVAAILILMSAGVIFNPKTQEDVIAIGQSLSNHMTTWGVQNSKQTEVQEWIDSIVIYNPFGVPDGDDDGSEDDSLDWKGQRIKLAQGLLGGIALWVAGVILDHIPIYEPGSTPTYGFSVTSISTARSCSYYYDNSEAWRSCLYNAYINNQAIVLGCYSTYMWGYYWRDDGLLYSACWENPLGSTHASVLGVYPLDELTIINSQNLSSDIYFSKEHAEVTDNFMSSKVYAFDWDTPNTNNSFNAYYKDSSDITWSDTVAVTVNFLQSLHTAYTDIKKSGYVVGTYAQYPISADAIIWTNNQPALSPDMFAGDIKDQLEDGTLAAEDIPLQDIDYSLILPDHLDVTEGIQNVVQQFYSGDMTLDKYLELTKAADDGAEAPTIVAGIPYGSTVTYFQNGVSSEIKILASVSDGGTLSYEWYRYGNDADGKPYPVEVLDTDNIFVPPTEDLGTSHYYCRVINTDPNGLVSYQHTSSIQVDVVPDPNADPDPGTGTDPDAGTDSDPDTDTDQDISDKLEDAFQNSADSEKQHASDQGADFVDQLTGAIPDYHEGFVSALGEFASNFSYEGTDAILTIPQVKFPEIPGKEKGPPLVKSFVMMEEKKVDFGDYVAMMPENLLLLVQCLLTGALIIYCGKELYDAISYVLTLRKGG